MSDLISGLDPWTAVLGGSIALLVAVLFGTELWLALRTDRLARTDPPTAAELEEMEERLGAVGAFRLTGGTSTPSRLFETEIGPVQGKSEDRGRGCYRPTLARSWRDRSSLV